MLFVLNDTLKMYVMQKFVSFKLTQVEVSLEVSPI